MKEELLNRLPNWYKNIDAKSQYLILSNDFDSWWSCKYLNQLFGIQVGGFFDLNKGLYLNHEIADGKEPIAVDLAVTGDKKTFDNHYSLPDLQRINPNVIKRPYFKKYNGSTFAMMLSLYNRDLSALSERQLTALLVCDGWYQGYYNKGGRYKDVNIYWMQMLDMDKCLLPLLESYDQQYFESFRIKEKINATFCVKDKRLHCDKCRIHFPDRNFELVKPVKRLFVNRYTINQYNNILTAASTYKDQYSICIPA